MSETTNTATAEERAPTTAVKHQVCGAFFCGCPWGVAGVGGGGVVVVVVGGGERGCWGG